MKIGDVDLNRRVFIIAEIGNNHEGSFDVAKDMVALAKESGADAVKFQTIRPERLVSASEKDRFNQLKRYEFNDEKFIELADLAQSMSIMFLSTPFDFEGVDMLNQVVPAFKIASGDLNNIPLVQHIATKGKPIILSTGMAFDDEISRTLQVINQYSTLPPDEQVALLHCISAYPTPLEQANLFSIRYLKDRFNKTVGYSDHTLGILACQTAVALGSRIIEKHFTYCKENQTFRDHALSADPVEMKILVKNIREIEKSLGQYGKKAANCERDNLKAMRRSIVLNMSVLKGQILQREMVDCLRPGTGIGPERLEDFLGRRILRDLDRGYFLKETDFE